MKKMFLFFLLIIILQSAIAQNSALYSLKKQLQTAKSDTGRIRILAQLSEATYASKPDIALIYAQQCYELSLKIDDQKNKANSFVLMASAYGAMADYAKNMALYLKALKIYTSLHDDLNVIRVYVDMGDDYLEMHDYRNARLNSLKADSVFRSLGPASQQNPRFKKGQMIAFLNIGESYLFTGKLDSAEIYLHKVYSYANRVNNNLKTYSYKPGSH